MNYLDIVKRAWGTTWRYKILWLFGLFAGAGGGGGSNFNWNIGSGTGSGTGNPNSQQILEQLQAYLPLLVAIAVVLVVLGIVSFVLTFAAKGGLVHLVNEAEEKRSVKAADGWRVGFSHWGRVFLIDFIIGLPVLVVVFIFALVFGASIVGLVAGAGGDSQSAATAGAVLSGVGGMCCAFVFLFVAVFAYSIVLGTTGQLALRYAILEERTAIESLKQGWADVWAKRGAIAMFFVTWATSIVYSVVLSVLMIAFIVPIVLMTIAGNIVGVVLLGSFSGLLAMLPAAVYGAFAGSAWTIFFRRMTGRDQGPAAMIAPAYAGGFPPAPPAPPGAGFPEPPSAEYSPPPEPTPPADDPWKAAQDAPVVVPPQTTVPGPEADPGGWTPPPPPPEGV